MDMDDSDINCPAPARGFSLPDSHSDHPARRHQDRRSRSGGHYPRRDDARQIRPTRWFGLRCLTSATRARSGDYWTRQGVSVTAFRLQAIAGKKCPEKAAATHRPCLPTAPLVLMRFESPEATEAVDKMLDRLGPVRAIARPMSERPQLSPPERRLQ
jgi:hypothetical protein